MNMLNQLLFIHFIAAATAFAFSKPPAAINLNFHIGSTALATQPSIRSSGFPTHKMTLSSSDSNESADRIIHWAIVGLGDVCTVKAGPAFYKCHGSTLSAVMRRTPGAAHEWIENNKSNLPPDVAKSIRAFENVEEMISEMSSSCEALDAIYVASPPGAHLENIRQIVKSIPIAAIDSSANNNKDGMIKAVYMEKPCGRCAWETRAIIDELRARNIEFYPAYVSRAHERTQVLRRLLGVDKVCGEKVTSVKYTQRGSSFARGLDNADGTSEIPWRLNAEQSGGGLIMDMGCHVLDRIDYLFGPLENVQSTVLRKGASRARDNQLSSSYPLVEDYVSMTGTVGECNWSVISSVGAKVECLWDFSPKENDADDADELIISGPKGSLRMGGMGAGLPIDILDANGQVVKTLEFDPPQHAAQPLIQSVVDEMLGCGSSDGDADELTKSPARADNAIRTSEVLDAILGSYYGGRQDEFWSRSETTWPGI